MSDFNALAEALAPYIEEAVSTAVREALARAATAVPMDGSIVGIQGATASVSVVGQAEPVPATIANAALAYGDRVVVVFYGNGLAYAHGPIPANPPPL